MPVTIRSVPTASAPSCAAGQQPLTASPAGSAVTRSGSAARASSRRTAPASPSYSRRVGGSRPPLQGSTSGAKPRRGVRWLGGGTRWARSRRRAPPPTAQRYPRRTCPDSRRRAAPGPGVAARRVRLSPRLSGQKANWYGVISGTNASVSGCTGSHTNVPSALSVSVTAKVYAL